MTSSIDRNQLMPGTIFTYYGPRPWLVGRRGISFGRVLALQPDAGIAHLRTFWVGSDDELEVDVGFLPLLMSRCVRSIAEISGTAAVPYDAWSSLAVWREARSRGEAGAFLGELWEAERMAWQVVREGNARANRQNTWIEYAYPGKGEKGEFNKLVVAFQRRPARRDAPSSNPLED